MYIIFMQKAEANRGLPGGEVDRRWEEPDASHQRAINVDSSILMLLQMLRRQK